MSFNSLVALFFAITAVTMVANTGKMMPKISNHILSPPFRMILPPGAEADKRGGADVAEYNRALKSLIKARFGSESEMARQVGRSRQSISKMTRKGRSPKISELNWWAEVLGTSVAMVVDAFQTAQ